MCRECARQRETHARNAKSTHTHTIGSVSGQAPLHVCLQVECDSITLQVLYFSPVPPSLLAAFELDQFIFLKRNEMAHVPCSHAHVYIETLATAANTHTNVTLRHLKKSLEMQRLNASASQEDLQFIGEN